MIIHQNIFVFIGYLSVRQRPKRQWLEARASGGSFKFAFFYASVSKVTNGVFTLSMFLIFCVWMVFGLEVSDLESSGPIEMFSVLCQMLHFLCGACNVVANGSKDSVHYCSRERLRKFVSEPSKLTVSWLYQVNEQTMATVQRVRSCIAFCEWNRIFQTAALWLFGRTLVAAL